MLVGFIQVDIHVQFIFHMVRSRVATHLLYMYCVICVCSFHPHLASVGRERETFTQDKARIESPQSHPQLGHNHWLLQTPGSSDSSRL